jgi:hypothetical protein
MLTAAEHPELLQLEKKQPWDRVESKELAHAVTLFETDPRINRNQERKRVNEVAIRALTLRSTFTE